MATGLFSPEDSWREKQRLSNKNNNNNNNKVYTRKNHNKPKNTNDVPKQERQSSLQTLATTTEDNTTTPPVSVESDDSSSHNQRHPLAQNNQTAATNHNAVGATTSSGYVYFGNKVKINLNCITTVEAGALKRKLVSELDQVRSLVKELQKKEVFLSEYSHRNQGPQLLGTENNRVMGSLRRVNSEVGSVGFENSPPFKGLSGAAASDNNGSELIKKDKRMPKSKSNQHYKNSDSVVGKEKFGKMASTIGTHKKSKMNGGIMEFASSSKLFKSCSNLLSKLMKHKFGWVFNVPVDPKKLGLHDYFTIIKHPMDLGTIKSRLSKNWYKSAKEFAEDVRLTFSNAMLYNPKGQDVHYMAGQLMEVFEEKWKAIEDEFNLNRRVDACYDMTLPTPTSRRVPANPVSVPTPAPLPPPRPSLDYMTMPVEPRLNSDTHGHMARTPMPKKPRVKEPERDMTYEEKQRLSLNLQSLPSEELDSVVQIIKKRNPGLFQQEDEVEVDIESVDPETLWELDRFVATYKKSLSKNKKKAEFVALQTTADAGQYNQENRAPPVVDALTETGAAVEIINASPPPVQGEQQGDYAGGSSSSSSSSSDSGSSSSDSDSDSSSGSGSDADQ
ncbi:Bromodomain domain-containing protein [Cephalotus follicularis]|uniref:Bromodomain domain-containing protein n=1 Tax=Cephalotus follicularis TaxID=3775 RepID=A0A1Q3B820_CEPFO|nr:Bromodomain domain-containing protein [Cephalotus follicularis]